MKTRLFKLSAAFALVALAIGCTSTSSTPTVTINGDQCSYEGPRTIPAKVTFTFKLETPIPSTPQGFAFVRLAEGKTLEDLKTVTTWDHPEWVTELGHYGAIEAGTWTHDFDWASNGLYHGEPIFVICGIGGTRRAHFGAFGPLEVKP